MPKIFAPNSIYHDQEIKPTTSNKDRLINCTIIKERYVDFVEWLFDQSNHINSSIDQSEAWEEFNQYELNSENSFVNKPIDLLPNP